MGDPAVAVGRQRRRAQRRALLHRRRPARLRGLRGRRAARASGASDFDYRLSRSGDAYYVDNNSRPSLGGNAAINIVVGQDHDHRRRVRDVRDLRPGQQAALPDRGRAPRAAAVARVPARRVPRAADRDGAGRRSGAALQVRPRQGRQVRPVLPQAGVLHRARAAGGRPGRLHPALGRAAPAGQRAARQRAAVRQRGAALHRRREHQGPRRGPGQAQRRALRLQRLLRTRSPSTSRSPGPSDHGAEHAVPRFALRCHRDCRWRRRCRRVPARPPGRRPARRERERPAQRRRDPEREHQRGPDQPDRPQRRPQHRRADGVGRPHRARYRLRERRYPRQLLGVRRRRSRADADLRVRQGRPDVADVRRDLHAPAAGRGRAGRPRLRAGPHDLQRRVHRKVRRSEDHHAGRAVRRDRSPAGPAPARDQGVRQLADRPPRAHAGRRRDRPGRAHAGLRAWLPRRQLPARRQARQAAQPARRAADQPGQLPARGRASDLRPDPSDLPGHDPTGRRPGPPRTTRRSAPSSTSICCRAPGS